MRKPCVENGEGALLFVVAVCTGGQNGPTEWAETIKGKIRMDNGTSGLRPFVPVTVHDLADGSRWNERASFNVREMLGGVIGACIAA
jgi:hypothetical protein